MLFTEARERAKAFAVYGAIAGGGAAVGLLLGGVLTEYADWRWCLLVNIPIALIAAACRPAGAGEPGRTATPATTSPARSLVDAGLVSLVYGFTKAADGRLGAGATSASSPAAWRCWSSSSLIELRSSHPLLPLRIVLDRNRGGAFLAVAADRRGPVRGVPVPDLLLPGGPGILAAEGRARLAADDRRCHRRRRRRQPAGARVGAKPLMVAGGVVGHGGHAAADPDRRGHRVRQPRAAGRAGLGLGLGFVFVPLSNLALVGVRASTTRARRARR